jgi:hypothetical protein
MPAKRPSADKKTKAVLMNLMELRWRDWYDNLEFALVI